MMNLFTGFILAGGKSSRMGADKAFLEIDGETFLARAVKTLSKTCTETEIVLNRSQTHFLGRLPFQTPHIFDIFENRGALGGMHAAFRNCKTEFAVILAVDLPFVTSEAIENLQKLALGSNDFAAIVPRQIDGFRQPLCAVYRVKDCLPEIEPLLKKSDSAPVKNFLKLIPTKYIDSIQLSQTKNLLFNINNTRDFQEIRGN